MIPENAKSIPNSPGYFISRDGDIWSEKSKGFLSTWINKEGYCEVSLYSDHVFSETLPRLLLMAFDRLPQPGEVARHLNDIKLDDRLENLAWGTRTQNIADAVKNGRLPRGEQKYNSKLFPLDAINIFHLRRKGYTFSRIGKIYGIHEMTASNIVKGRGWKYLFNLMEKKHE